MYGIGVDMTQVSRIEKSLQKQNFISFVYGLQEQALFWRSKPAYASLAANFAAKEAFSKALGTGVRGFALNEVEVLRDKLGKPYFAFSGNALQLMQKNRLQAQVSLSHEKDFAIAFVVIHKANGLIDL